MDYQRRIPHVVFASFAMFLQLNENTADFLL